MKEYEQDYYFNKQNNSLQENENKKVNKCFTVWLVCVIVSFAVPFLTALFSIIITGFNPLAAIIIIDYAFDIFGVAGYLLLPLLAFASIVQHILAIVSRIKYPLNEKANKMFKADMVILAVTAVALVALIVSTGIFCSGLLAECEDCG